MDFSQPKNGKVLNPPPQKQQNTIFTKKQTIRRLSVHSSSFFVSSFINSVADFLNSDNVSPAALPISGNFFGPKIINANTTIKINPGTPMFANPKHITFFPKV